MTQINPYLTFDGNCREAMNFYKDCLGGELTLQPLKGSPLEKSNEEPDNRILHSSLTKNGTVLLLASDMAGRDMMVKGNAISLSLNCSSEEEIKNCFTRLSTGGVIVHPLHDFFAGVMGTLTDKYEKDWLLYFNKRSEDR